MASSIMVIRGERAGLIAALDAGAGAVCIDIEDTVEDKRAARDLADEFLRMPTGGFSRTVRINSLRTREGLEDLLWLAATDHPPDAVRMAKVQHPVELEVYASILPAIPVSALIETPSALEIAFDIARADAPLTALSLGGKDMSHELGAHRDWEGLSYARARIVQAAAANGLGVWDGPFHPPDDEVALVQHCARLKALGFTGMSTVMPSHVGVINEVFGR